MTAQSAALTVVIVLYKRSAEESEAFHSLQHILADPRTAPGCDTIHLLLYDNSPAPQSTPAVDFAGELHYIHDPLNGGLAAAYNYALAQARREDSEWLLLLDQDTTVTHAFVDALLLAIREHAADRAVSAIVPLLEMNGRIYSPEASFFYHLRHQFPHPQDYPVARNASGVQTTRLNAYNSGAAIRVSALERIGGFPADFRLDYLDHAVFHRLQQQGGTLHILPVLLQQQLSHNDLNAVPFSRHRSVLESQIRFVARYGSIVDRLLFRLWLLRKSRLYRHLCSNPRVWRAMVRQALLPWPAALTRRTP